jgi:tetratricopeptide (TPR) repeat protein
MTGDEFRPPAIRLRGELRRQRAGAMLIAVGALVLGALLVPRGDELLLIHARNHELDRAATTLLERPAAGVPTVSSVVAHSELFLTQGRIGEALSDLEAFVTAHPDDLAAWTRLARLYGDAYRLRDQVRATGEMYRLDPTPANARRLSTYFRWMADDAQEAAALRPLVRSGTATPFEYARSARLDAALGDTASALATLDALKAADAGAFDYPLIELYASLAAAREGPARVGPRVQALPAVVRDPLVLQRLASAFLSWGQQDAAFAIFDAPADAVASADLLTMRARAAMGTTAAQVVVADLVQRDAASPFHDPALQALVDLALSIDDYASIERVLGHAGRRAPSAVLATVVGYAVSHGARLDAQAILRRFGDDVLAEAPVLALELAVERGDTARAAEWIRRIDAAGTASPEELVAVATLETRLGRRGAAFARLEAVIASGAAPVWAYRGFADLATDPAARATALAALEAQAPRMPEARRAWVGVAVALGRADLIDAWIGSPAVSLADAESLRDAFSLLMDRGNREAGVRVAARLAALRGSPDDHLLLGQALLATERPVEALAALRRAKPSRPEAQAAYETALAQTLLAGHDVAAEVKTIFPPRLRTDGLDAERRALLVEALLAAGEQAPLAGDVVTLASNDLDRWLSPLVETARAAGETRSAIALVATDLAKTPSDSPRRERLVRALMDLDAPNAVLLPHLEAFALERRDSWTFAYDERLAQEFRTGDRVSLWSRLAALPDASVPERRTAASRLIELGASSRAADVLQTLAAAAGPADPDVQQLLWLWGPRPDESRLRWLLSRHDSAPPADQAAWLAHLANAGGEHLVVEAIPEPPAAAGAGYLRTWIDAHRAGADPAQLRAALATVLARDRAGVDTRRYVGTSALAGGLTDLAERAFEGVLAAVPGDPQALRWLGTLAFYRGDTAAAFTHLAAYAAQGGGEPEALYQLGELWLARHEPGRARALYTRALNALDAADAAAANPVLRANVLVRLDDRAGAVAAFDRVLHDDPANRHARADYAVALLRWGRFDDAGRILEAQRLDPDLRDVDGGGRRRLDLLRAQWLNESGRAGAARDQLEALAARHPADPDVLVARATFDQARGRLADADRQLQAAHDGAPAREDIAQLVEAAAQERAPRVSLSTERSSIGPWTATSGILSLASGPRQRRRFAVTMERQRVTAPPVLRADGSIAPLDVDLTRVEGTATVLAARDAEVRARAFAADGGFGGGGTFVRRDLRGAWTVAGDVNRPFWDLLESAAAHGRKDQWSVQREWRFRPDTAAWAVAGWNRYRLPGVASTTSNGLTLGVVRTVRRQAPSLTLQYGLDTERVRRATRVTIADGRTFAPIPLVSREVHVFGLLGRAVVGRFGEVDVSGGYAVDRLGGHGSFLAGRLTPHPAARIGLELWGERRLYQIVTTQQALRFGVRGAVRF